MVHEPSGGRDANDGRGDRDVERAQRSERQSQSATANSQGRAPAGVVKSDPVHNDVADSRGDRDNDNHPRGGWADHPSSTAPRTAQANRDVNLIVKHAPAIPIKPEIALRLSEGCGKDEDTHRSAPLGARLANGDDHSKDRQPQQKDKNGKPTVSGNERSHESAVHAVGQKGGLSRQQREQVCKRFGVCIAGPASDDVEDKTE